MLLIMYNCLLKDKGIIQMCDLLVTVMVLIINLVYNCLAPFEISISIAQLTMHL